MSKNTLSTLTLQALRNDAHFRLHSEIAKLIAEITAAALHVPDLAPLHAARLADVDAVLKSIPKSPLTEQLHQADKARDETFRGLVLFVKAACLHFTPLTRAAARRLKIVVDTYGNVTHKSYEEESSAIYNLVQDLNSDKYAPDALAIGLKPWVDALNDQNNAFITILDNRDNEYAAKSHIAVRDARHAVDETYGDIALRVTSHLRADNSPEMTLFVNKHNVIIKRFRTLIPKNSGAGHEHPGHTGGGAQGGTDDGSTGGSDGESDA